MARSSLLLITLGARGTDVAPPVIQRVNKMLRLGNQYAANLQLSMKDLLFDANLPSITEISEAAI